MTEHATPVEQEVLPRVVEEPDDSTSEDGLIRRAVAERAAGRDTSGDVEALVRLAAKRNRAALDRLAK
jgi:hypothetical protein